MYYPAYEKRFIRAYSKTDLYLLATVDMAVTLTDLHRQYKRGLTVKQVITVLNVAMKAPHANYASITLALDETQPTNH
jgi:hypothetical protein